MISYKEKLWRYLQEEEGFTLDELIVVVVIIGILSSIAIPSLQNATKKARQSGAGAQISTYIKAAKSFYAEYSIPINKAGDLGQYVNVLECRYHLIEKCKGIVNNHRDVAVSAPSTRVWNSTSGMYTLSMRNSNNSRFLMHSL